MHCRLKVVAPILILLAFLEILAVNSYAATITWTGRDDDLASNPLNWSTGLEPQDGDNVIFNGTSAKNCTWNLTVTLLALTIDTGYTGNVTLLSNTNLTIAMDLELPDAPSGLSATAISSSEINLSWTDNSDDEVGFKIERMIGTGGTYTQIATVGVNETSYVDTGLTLETAYYYRIRAYSSIANSNYSDETNAITFSILQPTAATASATDIGGSYTTLNATVNPNGSNTTAYFQWGTDTSYGNTTSPQSIGNGTVLLNINVDLSELSSSTTYHYRIVADNEGGTSYGQDMSFTTPGWYDINWLYRQKVLSRQLVTIESGISPTEDLYDFPVLIKTSNQLNTVFDKALSDGKDVAFTLSDGLTRLDHQIESFINSDGSKELVAWVKIPILSSSLDTTVYMYYGYSDASDQQNPEDVWDSNFKGVWHLNEEWQETGTVDLYLDSTENNNHGYDKVSASGQNGQIGKGQEFDGIDDYIDIADSESLDITDKITIEAWVYLESNTGYREMIMKGNDTYGLYFQPGTNIPAAIIYQSGYVSLSFGSSINLNEWTHLSFTYEKDGGANNFRAYINGNLATATTKTGPIDTDDYSLSFGASEYFAVRDVYVDGFMDEVRISDINRSDEWIKATFNNQFRQESDLIFSAEESYITQLAPTVVSNEATNINGDSADLNATVIPNGSETTAYFEWGTDTSYGNTTNAQSIGSGATSISITESLTSLSPGTTYHYRTVATNDTGTGYGDDIDFITESSITWTGLGADNYASTSANWAGGLVPQSGDDVVFSTSEIDCIWDLNVSPNSIILISAYEGTVTLNLDLTVAGNLTVDSGTFNLNDKNLNVDGFILIGPAGTLVGTSSTISVNGDWGNWGNFVPDQSTVILNGTNQTIYGNTTFYNLTKIVTAADILYFDAESIQTISNNLILQGSSGELLSLQSTSDGSFWFLDPQRARSISFVTIKDLKNTSFVNIITNNSEDTGNNDGVSFGGDECTYKVEKLFFARILFTDWRQSC